MQKQANIPPLRFPEFKGEWELKPFGKLTTRVSNPVDVDPEEMYQQIGIKSHGKGIFHKEFVDGKALGNKRVFWVKENALVVNIVFAWEQAVAKTTSKELGMIASHRFPMYLPIENTSHLDYLLHFFLTKKGKALLELASPGGAGRNKTLGQKEFENLKFKIPSYAEQRKIASFLSVVNRKISELNEKKNLLEQYKKGVMQQIFSQDLRFKDNNGKEFPKWEKKKLSELTTLITKGTTPKHFSPAGINFVKIECFQNNRITTEKCLFIDEKIHTKELKRSMLVEGDLLFAIAGSIGKCGFVNKEILPANTNQALAIIRLKDSVNRLFVYHNLKSNRMKKYILDNITTGAQPNLNLEQLGNFSIPYPTASEQDKISNFFTAVDDKISQTENQIQQTQQYKKGLLQNMFV